MSVPVVLIVLAQPASPATAPALEGMLEATAEGLPPGTRVQLGTPAADARGADVVVVLRWADDTHRRATLHVATRDGRTSDREVLFAADDPLRERGRALGYAAVAIIPEDLRARDEAPRPPAPAPAPVPVPAPAPVAAEPAREVRPTARPDRLWVEATAQGSTGLAGSAGALGGGLAARAPFGPVALRAGVAVRAGDVSAASASSTLLRADLGAGFFTVVLDPRFTVGARAGVVLFRHELRRTETDSSHTSGTHTLMGAELLGEASWALGSRVAILAGAGTELAFGETRILVGPSQVTVIPSFRMVAELGARVRF